MLIKAEEEEDNRSQSAKESWRLCLQRLAQSTILIGSVPPRDWIDANKFRIPDRFPLG